MVLNMMLLVFGGGVTFAAILGSLSLQLERRDPFSM